jgi:chromosome segregation ATPase
MDELLKELNTIGAELEMLQQSYVSGIESIGLLKRRIKVIISSLKNSKPEPEEKKELIVDLNQKKSEIFKDQK